MAWFVLACVAGGAFLAGWRGGLVAIVIGGVVVVAWAIVTILIASGTPEVGGFTECVPDCTFLEELVAVVFFIGPVMLVVLVGGRLAAWLARRLIG